MLLYKAEIKGGKRWASDDMMFFATSILGAITWAKILYAGTEKQFYIHEYKVPNNADAIYNYDSYIWTSGGWSSVGKESGIEEPIPLKDVPKDIPPHGQIAVFLSTPPEFRQIAYYDNGNLISKKKIDQNKIIISDAVSTIIANGEIFEVLFDFQLINSLRILVVDPDDDYRFDMLANSFPQLLDMLDTQISLLDDTLTLDGLTEAFTDFWTDATDEYVNYIQIAKNHVIDLSEFIKSISFDDLQQPYTIKMLQSYYDDITKAYKDLKKYHNQFALNVTNLL